MKEKKDNGETRWRRDNKEERQNGLGNKVGSRIVTRVQKYLLLFFFLVLLPYFSALLLPPCARFACFALISSVSVLSFDSMETAGAPKNQLDHLKEREFALQEREEAVKRREEEVHHQEMCFQNLSKLFRERFAIWFSSDPTSSSDKHDPHCAGDLPKDLEKVADRSPFILSSSLLSLFLLFLSAAWISLCFTQGCTDWGILRWFACWNISCWWNSVKFHHSFQSMHLLLTEPRTLHFLSLCFCLSCL